jgi:hypothetical protein
MLVRHGDGDQRVRVKYLDITMLGDFDLTFTTSALSTPRDEPLETSKESLKSQPPASCNLSFDLAVCDGQVLRTHRRDPPLGDSEPTRLLCAQLVIALMHLKPGGTLVILLHKPDRWNSARFIHTIDSFSSGTVCLFKLEKKHATRSSFYLVAKGVQSDHPEAKKAVEIWKKTWLAATKILGLEDEKGEGEKYGGWSDWEAGEDVEKFLEAFGERLITLGTPIWKIQADALERAPYIKATGKWKKRDNI